MQTQNEIFFGGRRYISSKRAAEETQYSSDYIGQLCRAGKIRSHMVGIDRFVELESLLNYKNKLNSNTQDTSLDNVIKEIDYNLNSPFLRRMVIFVSIMVLIFGGYEFSKTTFIRTGYEKLVSSLYETKNLTKEVYLATVNNINESRIANISTFSDLSKKTKSEFNQSLSFSRNLTKEILLATVYEINDSQIAVSSKIENLYKKVNSKFKKPELLSYNYSFEIDEKIKNIFYNLQKTYLSYSDLTKTKSVYFVEKEKQYFKNILLTGQYTSNNISNFILYSLKKTSKSYSYESFKNLGNILSTKFVLVEQNGVFVNKNNLAIVEKEEEESEFLVATTTLEIVNFDKNQDIIATTTEQTI